jgi:predicted nucleic acid-binding protein
LKDRAVIVLDTSFLVAFHNSRDVHHSAARPLMNELVLGKWGRALLLEYVFLEVTTVLLMRRNLSVASSVASILLQAREIDFVPCSELFIDTLETFRNQSGTAFSFPDAAIITAARRYNVPHVATFDREFAGLNGIAVVP